MLLIPCPFCGPRAEIEFRYAGEAHRTRPAAADDTAVAAYLHLYDNWRGLQAERWRHVNGCGQFFNVMRDTATDAISGSYPADATAPQTVSPA